MYCIHCGERIAADSHFCNRCGQAVSRTEENMTWQQDDDPWTQAEMQIQNKKNGSGRAVFLLLIILGLLLLSALVYFSPLGGRLGLRGGDEQKTPSLQAKQESRMSGLPAAEQPSSKNPAATALQTAEPLPGSGSSSERHQIRSDDGIEEITAAYLEAFEKAMQSHDFAKLSSLLMAGSPIYEELERYIQQDILVSLRDYEIVDRSVNGDECRLLLRETYYVQYPGKSPYLSTQRSYMLLFKTSEGWRFHSFIEPIVVEEEKMIG